MNMNRISKIIALAFVAVAAMACGKEDIKIEKELLEVNANNIAGKWQLVQWNGDAMEEGTYVYLEIVRNDRTFTLYQNQDSFQNVPRILTGSYNIDVDPEAGAVIRGMYDHDNGEWSHRYIVKELYVDEMLWVAKDDPGFTQLFKRIHSIPVVQQ